LIRNIKNIRQIKKLNFFLTIYFSNYLIQNIKNIRQIKKQLNEISLNFLTIYFLYFESNN